MLRGLLTYRPGLVLVSLVLWTAGFCVPILTGLVNQAVFDELDPRTAQGRSLALLFAALVVIAVLEPALMVWWRWTHATLEAVVDALVRTNLFSWLIARSGRDGRSVSPVTALGRLRDDVPGYTGLVNEWYRLFGEVAFVVIALVIMIRIDPLITLVTFLPLCAVVLLTHWMRSRLPRLWGTAREATTAVTNLIGDAFAGVQTVKAAGAETAVTRRFTELNDARMQAEVRSLVAGARIDAISQAAIVTGQGLILLVGAGAMLAGRFSIGDFVVFSLYLDWMLEMPRRVGRLLSQHKTSQKSLERLRDDRVPAAALSAHKPVYVTGRRAEPPVPAAVEVAPLRELVAEDLSYTYPGSDRGISGVNLRLTAGTITVLVGEVGSGKSTLLQVLLGLRTAREGRIRWNGSVVSSPAEVMRPPLVAYKPQVPRLFSDTLRENILLGLRPDERRLRAALHAAVLEDDVRRLASGLDTVVGARGVRLSGGQLQRAATARMYYRDAELYVVDDLSSALDEQTERLVWERMEEGRSNGATYLVVSHRPAALQVADQVLRLSDGRLV